MMYIVLQVHNIISKVKFKSLIYYSFRNIRLKSNINHTKMLNYFDKTII